MSNPETELTRAIKNALKACGVWVVRIPRGVFRGKSGAYAHVAEDGFPDLLCLAPFGGLEIKIGTGKLRATQQAWRARAARHDVRYASVSSVQDALAVVRRWRDEDRAIETMVKDREALRRAGLE